MGYKKFDILIRKNSKVDINEVIKEYKKEINLKQDEDLHDLWSVHIFDLRTLKEYLIFSTEAENVFAIEDKYKIDDKTEVSGVLPLGQKIMDVEKSINAGIKRNYPEILKTISKSIDSTLKNLDNSKLEEEIKDVKNNVMSLTSVIKDYENIKKKLEDKVTSIESTVQNNLKEIQKEITLVGDQKGTIKKISKLQKEVKDKMEELNLFQSKIGNIENKLNAFINKNLSNLKDINNNIDNALKKLALGKSLTEEEKSLLKGALGAQGYSI